MKWRKQGIAAMVLAMVLTGCGGGTKTAEAEELLRQAESKMQTVESMAAEMTMEMDMALGETVMETTTVANILTRQEPLQMQMELSMDMGDGAVQQMQMYAEEAGEHLKAYLYSADTWHTQTMPAEELEQYDAEENMELYLEHLESYQVSGTEKIQDVQTTRIDGIMRGEAMEEAIESSGVVASAAGMGVTEEQLEKMYQDLKDLPLSLWIDSEGYVRKYELDLTKMMQQIMETALAGVAGSGETDGFSVQKTMVSMICGQFNQVGEITIPAEAKSAAVLMTEE